MKELICALIITLIPPPSDAEAGKCDEWLLINPLSDFCDPAILNELLGIHLRIKETFTKAFNLTFRRALNTKRNAPNEGEARKMKEGG